MEFKASHLLKSITLLLLCCAFFISKGKPLAPSYKNAKHITISKAFRSGNMPVNPFIKFNLIGGNQEAIRQAHKTTNTVYSANLVPQNIATCIRYFNFFSGYNNHRYTLKNADFLFPFHGFW